MIDQNLVPFIFEIFVGVLGATIIIQLVVYSSKLLMSLWEEKHNPPPELGDVQLRIEYWREDGEPYTAVMHRVEKSDRINERESL
jgi:hypothetical protein